MGVSPETCPPDRVEQALAGGDVASVIAYTNDSKNLGFEAYCKSLVAMAQGRDVAAIIADDTQIAGRCDADGIHLEKDRGQLSDVLARFSPQKIVGCGGMFDRHSALQTGELNPDFLLLGKLGKDIKPDPHGKNLALGEWWAEFVEIPAIVPCGSAIESVTEVATTGVDFVLVQSAAFREGVNAADAIKTANDLLDEHAPELLEADG